MDERASKKQRVHHFGDLMGLQQTDEVKSCCESEKLSESTKKRKKESSKYFNKYVGRKLDGLERMMLTANGNLQRIVSSWCNCPVSVNVVKNVVQSDSMEKHVYKRQVELVCGEEVFGVADSVVTLSDPELQQAVSSSQVGIGQLFRQYNLLPLCELLSLREAEGRKIQRRYLLKSYGIVCDIQEVLDASKLPVLPTASSMTPIKHTNVPKQPNHYGDLMVGTQTSMSLDGEFSPFERVLLTANGNVQRLLSSYYDCPISVDVKTRCEKTKPGEYRRLVELVNDEGTVLCVAESKIECHSSELNDALENGLMDVGHVFGTPGEKGSYLPKFELLQVSKLENKLNRTYSLKSDKVTIIVSERFLI